MPADWPALDVDADVEPWCTWVLQAWAHDGVADAVTLASPVLAERVEAILRGSQPTAVQIRRLATSLARYLARMRGRATPFGLFAGVAPAQLGTSAVFRWSAEHRHHVRADGAWLAAVIARLESQTGLLRRLRVVGNDLVVLRGQRLVVPWQPHASDPGRTKPIEVSLRYTPPVAFVLGASSMPVLVADLIDKVAAEFPRAEHSTVEALVAELVARGVLITNLRPPLTVVDGLGHVVDVLHEIGDVGAVADAAALTGGLQAIHAAIRTSDQQRRPGRGGDRRALVRRMRSLSDAVAHPLAIDLRLDCELILPQQVAREAAAAAGVLLRLSSAPCGTPGWREYHAKFLDRYGPGAVIAVTQLADPVAGLGFPRHYGQPENARATEWSLRDEGLLVLAQQAALDGMREIVLDDDAIDALAGGSAGELRPTAHLDLTVEIRAATAAAMASGDFTVAVTGIGRSALATTGRFLHLLADQNRQFLDGSYAALPTSVGGALAAQLSFPPHHARVENVTRVPQVLPAVIPLGEHRCDHRNQISLLDLAVTADPDRMYLVSLSRRRVVEPVLTCAAAWHSMPPLARLLVELPYATSAPAALFDWGAASCLPFRPRVRYRRSILSPARWKIPAAALPTRAASPADWMAAMTALRERMSLPATVFVGTADRRLRLHLDKPMDLMLLRSHIDQASGSVTLIEAPTATDHGWCSGRAHEVVIPMVHAAPQLRSPAVVRHSGPVPLIGPEHCYLPGSTVLYAKLYAPADEFDTILTTHLHALLSRWDQPPLWWFVRYRHPAPHLRIRVRTTAYGPDAERVGAWAADMCRRGLASDLALESYRPEVARYGGDAAMTAVEELFAADSAAAVAQLAMTTCRHVTPDAMTAVSLLDLLTALLGGRDAAFQWLLNNPAAGAGAAIRDCDARRQALTMASLGTGRPVLPDLPGRGRVEAAWQTRREAATAYAGCLTERDVGLTPTAVAVSLLHLHQNRVRGIDPDAEARAHRLVRAIALAHVARSRIVVEDQS